MGLHLIGVFMRRSGLLAALVVLVLGLPHKASAQPYTWRLMVKLPTPIVCGYFWDAGLGVIASDTQIYYTRDGASWKPSASFPSGYWVNTIRSFDRKTLYAAVMDGGATPATNGNRVTSEIWRSNDSGVTWTYVSRSFAQNGTDVFWSYIFNAPMQKGSTVARMDSNHLAAAGDDASTLNGGAITVPAPQYSSDGGWTWNTGAVLSNIGGWGGYSVFADTINRIYYAAIENGWGLMTSTDLGVTWLQLTMPNYGWADGVEGAGDKIYCPANDIWMTSDKGATWMDVGKAQTEVDDGHFCVFGCNGLTVVSFDAKGGVWIIGDDDAGGNAVVASASTTSKVCATSTFQIHANSSWRGSKFSLSIVDDSSNSFSLSGSNPLDLTKHDSLISIIYHPHSILPVTASLLVTPTNGNSCGGLRIALSGTPVWGQAQIVTTPASVGCAPQDFPIRVNNTTCLDLRIDSLLAIDDTFGQFLSYRHDSLALAQSTDSILFRYRPPNVQTASTYHVRIRGQYEPYGIPFDTTVVVSIQTTHVTSYLTANIADMEFGSIPQCSDKDSTIIFQNTGCDTLRVLLNQPNLNHKWTVIPNADTLLLLPGKSDSIRIHFSGDAPGTNSQYLTYRYLGPHSDVVQVFAQVEVVAAPPVASLSSIKLDLGDRSTCANDTTLSISLTNAGCDSVLIANAILSAGNAFSLQNPSDTILPPNGTLYKTITYHPTQRGQQAQQLTLRISRTDGSMAHDTTIRFAGDVIRGTAYLQSRVSTVDMGAIYSCQLRDTTLWLRNSGCDTLTVMSGALSDPSYQSDQIFPLKIAPSDSAEVHISYTPDTTGHPTTINSTFTFISNADTGSTVSIPLQIAIRYPQHLSLSLSPKDSAKAGQAVTFKLILNASAPGVSALHFDLTNDDNLLSFVSASGNGLTWAPGTVPTTRSFTLSPVPPPGMIGTLTFQTFLSTTSATPITLSQPTFENSIGVSNNCIASVDDASSSFTYLYSCSERLMQKEMTGALITVESITPNPASNTVEVRVSGIGDRDPGEIEIGLFDVLGHQLASPFASNGRGSFDMDVSGVANGAYYLRISSGGFVVTKRVIIAR